MQPQLVKATPLLTFDLSDQYKATILVDIESAGMIQYHHLLRVDDSDGRPCLHFGAEWNSALPQYRDEPIFGQFDAAGHSSDDEFPECLELPLFVLRAISAARKFLKVPDRGPVDGEVWAIGQAAERLRSGEVTDKALVAAYRKALAAYDA